MSYFAACQYDSTPLRCPATPFAEKYIEPHPTSRVWVQHDGSRIPVYTMSPTIFRSPVRLAEELNSPTTNPCLFYEHGTEVFCHSPTHGLLLRLTASCPASLLRARLMNSWYLIRVQNENDLPFTQAAVVGSPDYRYEAKHRTTLESGDGLRSRILLQSLQDWWSSFIFCANYSDSLKLALARYVSYGGLSHVEAGKPYNVSYQLLASACYNSGVGLLREDCTNLRIVINGAHRLRWFDRPKRKAKCQ